MNKLSKKEKLFCVLYSNTRNGRESAARAGYTVFLEKTAERLLSSERIKKEIARLDGEKAATTSEVCAGLRRLAFGSGNDAIKLLYQTENLKGEDIETLDVFNIASVKKSKDGGLEIKFFDRQKALEKLFELSSTAIDAQTMPFYQALERSALSIHVPEGEDVFERD